MFKKASLLALFACALLFTQCSSDNDDDPPPPSSSSIGGTTLPSSSSIGNIEDPSSSSIEEPSSSSEEPSSSSEEPSSSSIGGVPVAELLVGAFYFGTDQGVGCSNSYIEIYNPGDAPVVLTGNYALHYKSMQRTIACDADCLADEAKITAVLESPLKMQNWIKLNLVGTIPARHSFLINLGLTDRDLEDGLDWGENSRLDLRDWVFDQEWPEIYEFIHNKGVKVVITSNQNVLPATLKNPFTGDGAGQIAGYVDMAGSSGNDPGYVDQEVDGCETLTGTCATSDPSKLQSKQKAYVRVQFDADTKEYSDKYKDTDDNINDFVFVDYRNEESVKPEVLPRNLAKGPWVAP